MLSPEEQIAALKDEVGKWRMRAKVAEETVGNLSAIGLQAESAPDFVPLALGAAFGAAVQAYGSVMLSGLISEGVKGALKKFVSTPEFVEKFGELFASVMPTSGDNDVTNSAYGAPFVAASKDDGDAPDFVTETPGGGVGTQPEDPRPRPYYVPVSKKGGYVGSDQTRLVDHPSDALVFETREACAAWCETSVPKGLAVEAPFVVYTAQ